MRINMLERPGVPETINQRTVPVLINATDSGFPQGLPALKAWEADYYRDPWTKQIYAFFLLMDPDGQQVFGSSGCMCIEVAESSEVFSHAARKLDVMLERHAKFHKLKAAANPVSRLALRALKKKIHEDLHCQHLCIHDLRLMTARFLNGKGSSDWNTVVELTLVAPRKGASDYIGARMRTAAVYALGEFIVDDRPFDARAVDHLRVIHQLANRNAVHLGRLKVPKKSVSLGKVQTPQLTLPLSLLVKAACTLSRVRKLGFGPKDPEILSKVQAWWRIKKQTAEFAWLRNFDRDHPPRIPEFRRHQVPTAPEKSQR
ncbi:MAG: hypothetical protein V3W41_00380 [Planctomycetota bacterium]